MVDRINRLILNEVYPFSSKEDSLNDFDIPDEVEEMQGYQEDIDTVNDVEVQEPSREDIITDFLKRGAGTVGSKGRIQKAMLELESGKDRVSFIKNEYGWYGSSGTTNGVHTALETKPKGLELEYHTDTYQFDELITWNEVGKRIYELALQDEYILPTDVANRNVIIEEDVLPTDDFFEPTEEDSKLILVPFTKVLKEPVLEEANVVEVEPQTEQINLFAFQNEIEQAVLLDDDSDGFITGDEEVFTPKLAVGTRVYYEDRVLEILDYLYDGNTVEIGDIEQLKGLNTFKVRERVPATFLDKCTVMENHYSDGELANLIVDAAENEDKSKETLETIKAASIINQTEQAFNHNLAMDFIDRVQSGTLNYSYSPEHNLYDGGAKTKCKANIEAIKLLKRLEEIGQPATSEQQIILAGYVGWGGLANALTPNKAGWESEYAEIKALLTEEEFKSAEESTTTAYFTEQMIIENIYKALSRFGFRGGNILDPAMGTGNFYSVLPENMKDSNLFGVELDSITGRIAQKLYPTAEIELKGFEETTYPDQFFDVAIGNIPFNNIQLSDKRYDKYNFKIHDYFIAKSLDKVRPGGIVAFITSKGTLDKTNQNVRKYIAQRAELIGAIRLPNTAFKQVAGTEVTSDILFFQKRERDIVPNEENTPWLAVSRDDNDIPMNQYFIDHPEMILGEMVFDESMYGSDRNTACHSIQGDDLSDRLDQAIHYLDCTYEEATSEFEDEKESSKESVPASPTVKNFSYTLVNDEIYYRENSKMYRQDITGKKAERIKGMIQIHSDIQSLVEYQSDEFIKETMSIYGYNENIKEMIRVLNVHYDSFVKEFGYLNVPANVSAFKKDGAAPLLRSIEHQNSENKNVYEKTAIFFKPTIHKKEVPKAVFNADDALMVCMNTKGRVDLHYMAHIYVKPNSVTGKATPEEIIEELGNKVYKDPNMIDRSDDTVGYVLADEYLSGYVKDKLATAKFIARTDPSYERNVQALERVQPVPLEPHEINFTLGSTWIPKKEYQAFLYELCETYRYNQGYNGIEVEFSEYTGTYHIANKSAESGSVTVNNTYGTDRKNAYEIIEDTLNLKKVEVRDAVEYLDSSGEKRKKYVVNQKETILAREKQSIIEQKFKDWLFAEPERSDRMQQLYNDLMNNLVVREYNGQDLLFPDMNESIKLRGHQRNVIAHGWYGEGNLLMAHEVGAGKTFSAIALTYELKRIGAVQKPLIAVPNHLVGQWATAYMELYPNANILVAEKRDFEKSNRRRFASRIAVGDYDAVIMAHSSFELIGLSKEYQLKIMEEEIADVTNAISNAKAMSGDKWSLKQMQIFQKNLQFRYEKLYNADKKDTVISFEQLGVDCLVVDESHAYKNNFSYTKLRNVAGIGSSSSQRAMDMHMKAQYINQINDGKGVIYLTGTPISNSMAELYVLQKTLQPNELAKRKQLMFDSWASAYGVITSSLEIKPEGNGYQMKNRFSQFHNLPELMKMFRMVADIKTSDMLDEVPVPKLKNDSFTVVKTAITPYQKDIVMELAERAENIRSGRVGSDIDNFLKLTMEARLLATDPRMVDSTLPNDPDYKLNVCARKVAEVYHETAGDKLTQIIFCDQGTPKDDGSFNFYDATKAELIRQGVEPHEIAYIHDANTDLQKEQLFEKVRSGEIRVLIGSTSKMGTGMNVQDKLIALHHLDIPWRPSDLIQRNGRIIRQGNENEEVEVFNYITEDTFDSYLWQILEQKQRYISQIMSGDSTIRKCEDLDETVLQYAEFKALAISDPRIKEKMEVDNELSRLTILKSSYQSSLNTMKQKVNKHYPEEIQNTNKRIEQIAKDITTIEKMKPLEFEMVIDGRTYTERPRAAEHFKVLANKLHHSTGSTVPIGTYAGLEVSLIREFGGGMKLLLQGAKQYQVEVGESELGAITRLENAVDKIPSLKTTAEEELANLYKQLEVAKLEVEKPFPNEARLQELQVKKVQLDLALEFAQSGNDMESGGIEQKLYQKIYPMMKSLIDDEAYYIKYKSQGFEDLVIEKIGENEYSIAHYYSQNGDAMRDPEITFRIEHEGIKPLSFLQDNLGQFYETDNVSPEMVADLKEFMSDWFDNLNEQDYEVFKEHRYHDDDVEQDNGIDR